MYDSGDYGMVPSPARALEFYQAVRHVALRTGRGPSRASVRPSTDRNGGGVAC